MAANCSLAHPEPVLRTSCSPGPNNRDAALTHRLARSLAPSSRDGIGMSPLAFFEQLADSSWSVGLHESEIAYSIIESIHVWTMAVFFGLVVMFDLRLLGWTM